MEAVWGALGKGGPALMFFLPGTLEGMLGGWEPRVWEPESIMAAVYVPDSWL